MYLFKFRARSGIKFSCHLVSGMYYLRTKAAASAIQFTVDKTKLKSGEPVKNGKKPEEVDGPAEVKVVIIILKEKF